MSLQKEKITLPTGFGDAAAIQLSAELWWLKTPWSRELLTGSKQEAFCRLRELVWEAEARPEHNTVLTAVRNSIAILSAPSEREPCCEVSAPIDTVPGLRVQLV